MAFSLFECQDGTFVVVPFCLAPPAEVYRAHGESVLVSNACRHLYDTVIWDDISKVIDSKLYAVIHPEVAVYLFDVGESDAIAPRGSVEEAGKRPPDSVPRVDAHVARPEQGEPGDR